MKSLICYFLLLFFLLLFFVSIIKAQETKHYHPLSSDSTAFAPTISAIRESYLQDVRSLPEKYKDEFIDIYKSRCEKLISEIKEDYFVSDTSINLYFNKILQEIYKSNSSIPSKKIRLLISKAPIANAYCVGEGTIVVNLALLQYLESESQLAFVICHELAHYTLNHVNNAIASRVSKLNSESTQRELKAIAKAENGKMQRALALLKDILYQHGQHSRLHESSADSLAFIYLKNTNYNEREAMKALSILDEIDEDRKQNQIDLKKIFDSDQYPFKGDWLRKEEDMMSMVQAEEEEELVRDSLKTHPDCPQRIALLKGYLHGNEENKKSNFLQQESLFGQISVQSKFEVIESEFFFCNYDKCLYHTFLLLIEYPDDIYLKAMIGKCFSKIYEAQKKHELNKYVHLPSADSKNTDFQGILYFIHNLRLKEIANIGYFYLLKCGDACLKNEDYVYALFYFSQVLALTEEQKSFKNFYLKNFPLGKYKAEMK